MALACGSCGESNPGDAEFCLFCGAYLGWSGRQTAEADEPQATRSGTHVQVPEPVPPARPEPVPPVRPVPVPAVRPDHVRAVRAPDPVQQAPTVVLEPPADPPRVCPECARDNASTRRFCGHCGHQLVPTPVAARLPAAQGRPTPSWWGRVVDERERAARQAYRRSLPPVYRWRRVLAGALVVALLAAFGVVSRGHPVRWTLERWDDVRNNLVPVGLVQVAVEPAAASVRPSTPGLLLDRTAQAWTTSWPVGTAGSGCAPAPGGGAIVLSFPPTRIRAVDIYAGLSDLVPERTLQARPQTLGVVFGDGECRSLSLPDTYRNARVRLDSGTPVTSLRMTVQTAFPAPAGGQELLSITELGLLARPVR